MYKFDGGSLTHINLSPCRSWTVGHLTKLMKPISRIDGGKATLSNLVGG